MRIRVYRRPSLAVDVGFLVLTMATADSLRQKSRGAQSLPRRQSMHPGAVDGSSQQMPPPPRVRPKDKSKVETLMKRRYSMRVVPGPVSALEAFPPDLSSRAKAATGADASHADKVFIPACSRVVGPLTDPLRLALPDPSIALR